MFKLIILWWSLFGMHDIVIYSALEKNIEPKNGYYLIPHYDAPAINAPERPPSYEA